MNQNNLFFFTVIYYWTVTNQIISQIWNFIAKSHSTEMNAFFIQIILMSVTNYPHQADQAVCGVPKCIRYSPESQTGHQDKSLNVIKMVDIFLTASLCCSHQHLSIIGIDPYEQQVQGLSDPPVLAK